MKTWDALKDTEICKDFVDNYRNLFESRMSAGGVEKLPSSENLKHTFHLGPMTWKVMQRSAWKDIANWQTKKLNNYTQSQLHVLTTISSKMKK